MSLSHIRKIGLPLTAAVAVGMAVTAATAYAAPATGNLAGTGTYKSWPKAQQAAGFRLVQPGTTYRLRGNGPITVGPCEVSPRKRIVSASYGSPLKASLELQQDNAGKPCPFASFVGTRLGSYKIHGHPATMYGYCGFGVEPACTSSAIEMWISWKAGSDYYTAYSHDESRARLVHFASTLKKA
jgi:hypothetical protein